MIVILVDTEKWEALKEVLATDMLSSALTDGEHHAIEDFLNNAQVYTYESTTS